MMRGRTGALGLILLLALSCGDGESTPSNAAPPTGAPAVTAPTAPAGDVPDAVVRNVATGADVNVRTLAVADRPTLYWFWAPH